MTLTQKDLKNLLEDGIDPQNPCHYKILLADLQGNILKGHGRDFSVHLFLKFKNSQINTVKEWIQSFAFKYVKSAKQQSDESLHDRQESISGGLFANFFLSCKGYEYLNFQPLEIPTDQPFRMGMKNNDIRDSLGDPKVIDWEIGLQNDIHALVAIADDDHNELVKNLNKIKQDLCQIAEIVHQDDGFILKNQAKQTIEHFGFIDGISQPLFLQRDIDKARKESNFSKWDPRASLDLILVKDPNGRTDDSYGSYFVYRKLEQNVKEWNKDVQTLAKKLGVSNDLAGALVIGRFKDGTPVTLSDEAQGILSNNFNFDSDREGTKCPFHTHIRKTNPRGDTGQVESSPGFSESLATEKSHRIARRALSYGESDPTKKPEKGSGMLFMCFQADINNQFNFLQSAWSNTKNFVKVNVGRDPIIGQAQGSQKWPKKWGESETMDYDFQQWVTMKGGEYFFAPSISFLQGIAENTSSKPSY